MKIITSTLLIATLFTSNIIASQGCANGTCMASFGKKADNRVVAGYASFNKINSVPTITQPYVETQDVVNTNQEYPYVATNEYEYDTTFVTTEDETMDTEEYVDNSTEESVNTEAYAEDNTEVDTEYNIENNINTDTKFATLLKDKTLNADPYCEESQEVLTCDITGDTSECTCV